MTTCTGVPPLFPPGGPPRAVAVIFGGLFSCVPVVVDELIASNPAERAKRPREQAHEPFFLVISYLEPHFQNDCNCFVAPKGYAERYSNSFIPRDLSFFPGDWQEQLPDY